MTKTIEQQALDLINEVGPYECANVADATHVTLIKALRRTLESHAATKAEYEAFRREVSDGLHHYFGPKLNDVAQGYLGRFIIPKPDPLVEALKDADAPALGDDGYDAMAHRLRAALAARGLKLVEAGDAAA